MAEYDIEFSERLIQAAYMVLGFADLSSQQVALYLSLLSTEITLKAMLERAGMPVKHTHRIADLISDVCQCKVEVAVTPGVKRYVPATRIRSILLKLGDAETTVGAVIDAAESHEVSKYPNQVRYGSFLRHFPAEVVAQMAYKIYSFARNHWNDIRK